MKKTKIVYLTILFLIIPFISSCGNNENHGNSSINNSENSTKSLEILVIDSETPLTEGQCLERNLNDKIIMLSSEYCPHCAKVKPILEKLEEEKNVDIIFLELNGDTSEVRKYAIFPMYTPTVLIDCQVIIGERDKAYYEQLIK